MIIIIITIHHHHYSAPGWKRSISICLSVCVCLSVREHISGTAGPIFTKCCAQIPCGRGSVVLWRRCDTLCTSGFMDDVMFGCSCDTGAESDVYEYLAILVSDTELDKLTKHNRKNVNSK